MNKIPLIYLLPKNIPSDTYIPTKRETSGHIRAWQKKFAFSYATPAVRLEKELGVHFVPDYHFPNKVHAIEFARKYQNILWIAEGLIQDITELAEIYRQELVNPAARPQIHDKDTLDHARYIYTTLCEQTPMLSLITDPQNDVYKLQLFAKLVGWKFAPEDIQSVLFGGDMEREEILANKLCAFQQTLDIYTQDNSDSLLSAYRSLIRMNPELKKISNPTARINTLCHFFVLVGSLLPVDDIVLALYGSPEEKTQALDSKTISERLTKLGINPSNYLALCSWGISDSTWQTIAEAVYQRQVQDSGAIRSLFPVLQEDPVTPSEQEILQAITALRHDLPTSFIRKDELSPV